MRLRNSEKILLHLYEFRKYEGKYEYPIDVTQQGIAGRIGISVTHVPRNINKLIESGFVHKIKAHVPGKKKKITVYLLTPAGITETKKIIERLNEEKIKIGDKFLTVEEIKKKLNIDYLTTLEKLEKKEITPELLSIQKLVTYKEVSITIGDFVDREQELKKMEKWLEWGGILTIVGSRGFGKSYLIQRFLDLRKIDMHMLWIDLHHGRTWNSVKEVFKGVFGTDDILHILKTMPVLLIFDGYYDVDDHFVNALNSLVRESIDKSRIIVTMRKDTPYYNRFYSLADLAEERVTEIQLEGIPYDEAKQFLPDVRESAFKRIYQITRGNPKILSALKKGAIENESLPLNGEEVHLLNFLASQKK